MAAIVASLLMINVLGWGALRFDDIATRIVECASPDPGLTDPQVELMQQIASLGPAAYRRVLPLLQHEDPTVRDLATRILCRTYRLSEENLDALIEAKRAGNEVIAVAIARIGTPRAIAFLVEELKKGKRTGTQTYWALYSLGEKGVPPLVKLIENGPLDNEPAATVISLFGELRDKAGSAVDPLTEIVAARRDAKAVEWAVLALGAIGERARGCVPAVQKLAEEDSSYRNIVDRSLQVMNTPEKIADTLTRLGACSHGVSAVSELAKWAEQGDVLIDPLIEFISLRQGNENAIGWAVYLLGEIGPNARRAAPLLVKLAEEKPGSYRYAVDTALLEMGAPEAAQAAFRLLQNKSSRRYVIGRIVRLKELGRPARPVLVHCLGEDDWDLRLDAARAIAEIGYAEGASHLIRLLGEKDDWRQAFVAATSLGRLRAAQAVGPLTELAKSHWYPPVREAAEEAIRVIQGQAAYSQTEEDRLRQIGLEPYMMVKATSAPSDAGQSLAAEPNRQDEAQLAKLAYKEEQCHSYEDTEGQTVEKRYSADRVPQVGIRVADGYLVGFDQGEFGGELLFIDLTGKRTGLWENTQGIHKMPFGIVAVTGYGHFTDRGMLVKVFRGQDGVWQATRWKSLPGHPDHGSTRLANGNIRIDCGSHGCVELTASGNLKMAGSGM